MLTLEAAGAMLLVFSGVGVMVVLSCAALIFAKTKLAPHADCRRFNAAIAIEVAELHEKFNHRGKVRGGRASRAKQEEPDLEEDAVDKPSTKETDFQRIVRENALRSRVGG